MQSSVLPAVKNVRRVIASWLGYAISLSLLTWVLSQVEWHELGSALRAAHLWWLALGFVLTFIHSVIRAVRWRWLFPRGSEVPLLDRYAALAAGSLASYVLPFRAGEFLRPYALARRTGRGFSELFGSVVLERIFDLAFVLLLTMVVVTGLPSLPTWVSVGVWSLMITLVSGMVVFSAFAYLPEKFLTNLFDFFRRMFPPKIDRLFDAILTQVRDVAALFRKPKDLLYIVLYTAVLWVGCILLYVIFLKAFLSDATIFQAMTLMVFCALAVAAPSAPGFIGVYQAGCLAAGKVLGLPEAEVVAFSLASHTVQFGVVLISGLWGLKRLGIGLGERSDSPYTPSSVKD